MPATAPAPDPRAARPVLLFDGVCNLCHASVRFVIERDPAARFHFASLQSATGRALARDAGADPDTVDTVLLLDADGAHAKSEAALRVARALGPPWSWLWPLRFLPRRLRDAAYGFVAQRRFAWFGRKDHCPAPRPEWRARFLD